MPLAFGFLVRTAVVQLCFTNPANMQLVHCFTITNSDDEPLVGHIYTVRLFINLNGRHSAKTDKKFYVTDSFQKCLTK